MFNWLSNQKVVTRLFLISALLTIMVGLFMPQSVVWGADSQKPNSGGENILLTQYNTYKRIYKKEIPKLHSMDKGLNRLLNDYQALYNKGDKNWIQMRKYYYDYRSAYYAGLNHEIEGKLLMENHFGFNSKMKVVNQPLAKYTVSKFQGVAITLQARNLECIKILREAKQFMKDIKHIKPKK